MGQLDGVHHLRATPRYKLFQPGAMGTAGGAVRAHLLNVSAGGAMLHAPDAPVKGALLNICCGGVMHAARVAWVRAPKFGVSFVCPLATAEIDRLLAEQQGIVAAALERIRRVELPISARFCTA